ncbi:MAG: NAD+ synthase, partial [Gammaproteobacteria bacterium]|nr:NAD+ synthase [Gammaproteobacteria bacterium]
MTDGRLTIALAQLDLLVGDIDGNAARVQDTAAQLGTAPSVVDLVVFPELTLAGYPPED